ncbi:hypothetical protein QJS04_geneDACA021132 [Acorus gramineus]|uniref:Symplekin n=1 Tax=Acorus gramineus TaxID=55184 RepID=A0AAV9BR04_ACOGR|nr:hypothetical protein QJS04_geneDACA021132 [Acorus gramineus]
MVAVIGDRPTALPISTASHSMAGISSKLDQLGRLREILLRSELSVISEFLPHLVDLQNDPSSPVRKLVAEMIGDIGLKHMELLSEMVPILISFLKDEMPAVARQAISTGTHLFCKVLEKVAIQGIYSNELSDPLQAAWAWMLKFKDTVVSIAFQPGSEGVRLRAVKFIEALVLLYTPDPCGPSQPPLQDFDGELLEFNISWLRGGHPLLNVGDLAIEASESLGSLLDQLRFPHVKTLTNAVIIVLINSVSAVAQKRPAFYGRILPVLLSLDPTRAIIRKEQIPGSHHALKSAFLACLKCTHPAAAPWRDRLVDALKFMKDGRLGEQSVNAMNMVSGSIGQRSDSYSTKEEKFSAQGLDVVHSDLGQKRAADPEMGYLEQDDGISGKRIKLTSPVQGHSNESLQLCPGVSNNNLSSSGVPASSGERDTGPVQQLVSMFGSLVAQGDKAAQSLEILISSISADLLAEVVMANMRHLPSTIPKSEDDETVNLGYSSCLSGNSGSIIQTSAMLSNVLSLSSALPQLVSLLDAKLPTYRDSSKLHLTDESKPMIKAEFSISDANLTTASTAFPVPSLEIPSPERESSLPTLLNVKEEEVLESNIPGLDSNIRSSEVHEMLVASYSSTAELQGANQEQPMSSGSTMAPTSLSSGRTPSYISEVVNPRLSVADAADACHASFATSSSVVPSFQSFLPRMTAPTVSLTDEQKDHLQKMAFVRIVDSYKQISEAGGSHICFSLLACLGVEYPLELDSWGLLQKHILTDYVNHKGHELTLLILYRLFRESEQDQDFFSSSTATSVYETFLLAIAETLRDSFPASDKSLSRLLVDVPYLPKSVFKLLECLCSPQITDKMEDIQSGDRVTQGLSAVWNLILLRPPIRDVCLNIALQSAVHQNDEVRMKAIRLVANKLYPIQCIAQKIEDFASQKLLSVVDGFPTLEGLETEVSATSLQKDTDVETFSTGVKKSENEGSKEPTSDKDQGTSSSSFAEAQKCTSLFFALCTKVLHTLTDRTNPSSELILSVKKLYNSKLKDVEFLIPILPFLSKDEVSSYSSSALTPAEALIAIHGIDSEKDGVMDACSSCFEQREVFTQQVFAKALNQLVDFVMEILSRLVSKQLPAAQLENALHKNPSLKPALVEHADQPNLRSSLPRSTLVVLGLVTDSQIPSQVQTTQTPPVDTTNPAAEGVVEMTQESSATS